MRARERKVRRAVIEVRWLPRCGRVALCAVMAEARLNVRRIGGRRKGLTVTGETIGGRRDIAVCVALLTGHRCMRTGERKSGLLMVEDRRFPGVDIVAAQAVVIEATRHMVGIGCRRERFLVTGIAVARCAGIAFAVAGLTFKLQMRAFEWEVGQVVIKR